MEYQIVRNNYMMAPTLNTSTNLPDIVSQSAVPTNMFARRSLTTLPWRPANYYRTGYTTARGPPAMESRTAPMSSRSALTELEGIKVPHVFSAARNALYTRYTPNDWLKSSMENYNVSDRTRLLAERIRFDTIRLGRETDDKTKRAQEEAGKRLGDRITDTSYWKKELDHETDAMITEIDKLGEAKRSAEKLLAETENPLHITQECLYNREKRQAIDLVHDDVEKNLLGEIDIIKECQDKLRNMIQRAVVQTNLNRAAQHELEKDSRDKFMAYQLDESAHGLKNSSAGINYHTGVERIDNCLSVPETWAQFSSNNIRNSQGERDASRKLRDDIEKCIVECTSNMQKRWMEVNTAFSQRVQETVDAKNRTQNHLNRVQQEVFDMDKNIEYLKKCIQDKEAPLMVAQTRLDTRLRRPNMELCRDPAQNRLVSEVYEIRESVEQLRKRLEEAENSLQVLLQTKATLERDLSVKNNSLNIDREKCLGLRKTFPVGPRYAHM